MEIQAVLSDCESLDVALGFQPLARATKLKAMQGGQFFIFFNDDCREIYVYGVLCALENQFFVALNVEPDQVNFFNTKTVYCEAENATSVTDMNCACVRFFFNVLVRCDGAARFAQ